MERMFFEFVIVLFSRVCVGMFCFLLVLSYDYSQIYFLPGFIFSVEKIVFLIYCACSQFILCEYNNKDCALICGTLKPFHIMCYSPAIQLSLLLFTLTRPQGNFREGFTQLCLSCYLKVWCSMQVISLRAHSSEL